MDTQRCNRLCEPPTLHIKRLDDVERGALRELIGRSVRVRKGIDRASA